MEDFEDKKRKVDETWKEAVEKEKTNADINSKIKEEYPQEVTFDLFLSSLMIEGLIALGDVENPNTKKKEVNLGQARYIIDVIGLLEEKTSNNATPDEKSAIEHMLYELRMRYVTKTK
ncbi:MAG: DUF1844 domain-containing protein [Candidatus Omnitrophica bacterium]|nr:DUF1844 domain-containing protein [Candidatus Omnitrophota bacterium]